MAEVTRKGFVDKNGKQVVIVPNVPGATSGNLASFDAEGNLQNSGIDAGLVGNAKFLYRLGIQKSGGAYVWSLSTTQAMLEEVYSTLSNGPSDAIPVRVQIPGFIYAGYATKGQMVGVKELHIFVGTVAFQVYYNTTSNQWSTPILISSAIVLDALKSTEQLSSGNDYRLITSGAVKAAIDKVNEKIDNSLESKEDEYPILTLTLQKTENGKYPLTEADSQSLSSFVSAFPDHKTIPCIVNIDEVAIPAFVSKRNQRLGSNGPIRNFVLLSFSNRLFITNPSITTDNFWQELNEDMVVIPEFAIRVVGYTQFGLKSDNFSENALIEMRDNVDEGHMIRCRVILDVVHNEGHGYITDVSDAKLDGYIKWEEGSEEGEYVYTLLLGSSLFTLTSDDENLGSTLFVRNTDFRL